ncbi:interleukin-21 receptor-like isoform X3 [Toxotes jaculatrix]|uniref:interleukin-21 receptor-like isoform X3 n=1 Tax=Toxotes jaculatrix TaxID=941984 RepID=UPI001B3AE052|nr:interleukin-21 receptor-like isoform X3 [Toxotes jaculatrix]
MKCPQLLFVCWCSSILTVTSCFRADGYSCVSAYWNTITCVLNITGNPVGQSIATYSLKFIENWKKQNYACPLVSMNHSYSSVCEVTERKTFNHRQKYSIYLCNESVCHPLLEEFIPSRNIQLTPPDDVKVQPTPEAFNITWKSGYEEHMFFQSRLDYKLLLQKSQSSWSKNLSETQKFVSIRRDELDAYATYCIRVKSKPSSHLYKGAWSEWSPLTCWNNDVQQGEQDNKLVILIKSLAPVCVVAGVLLFVFYSPAVRMKIKTLSYTPSPAPFFQPLFEQNKGNLKVWVQQRSYTFPRSAMTPRRPFPTNMPKLRHPHRGLKGQLDVSPLDASPPWLKRNLLTWRRSLNGRCVRGARWTRRKVNVELNISIKKNLQKKKQSDTIATL